jgi:hypothetical protein
MDCFVSTLCAGSSQRRKGVNCLVSTRRAASSQRRKGVNCLVSTRRAGSSQRRKGVNCLVSTRRAGSSQRRKGVNCLVSTRRAGSSQRRKGVDCATPGFKSRLAALSRATKKLVIPQIHSCPFIVFARIERSEDEAIQPYPGRDDEDGAIHAPGSSRYNVKSISVARATSI